MTFKPEVPRAVAALVRGQDLDIRVLGESGLAPVDTLRDRHHRHAVDDHDIALMAKLLGKIFARDLTGRGVVHGQIDRRPLAPASTPTTVTPAAMAFFTVGSIASESAASRKTMSVPAAMNVSIAVTSLFRS